MSRRERGRKPGGAVPAATGARRPAGAGVLALAAAGALLAGGCSRESLRVALQAQQRADEIQQTVFERQHEALRVLLYRDLLRRLAASGTTPTAAQREALHSVWNDRDLLEFWAVQHERAGALRLVGVDAKLAGDQSVVELLLKNVTARAARARSAVARHAGAALRVPPGDAPADETGTNDGSER